MSSNVPRSQPQDAVADPNRATAGGSVAHVRGRPQSLDPRRVPPSQRQRSADAPVRNPDLALAAARARRHASAERVRGGPGRRGGGDAARVRALGQVSSSPAEGMRAAADAAGARAGLGYGAGAPEQAVPDGSGPQSMADPAISALEAYVAPGDGAPGRGGATGPRVSARIVPRSQAGGSARRRAPRTSGERARLLLQTVTDVEVCSVAAMLAMQQWPYNGCCRQCWSVPLSSGAACTAMPTTARDVPCCAWPSGRVAEQLPGYV